MQAENDTPKPEDEIQQESCGASISSDLLGFDRMKPDDLISLKVSDAPEKWEQIPKWQFELRVALIRFGVVAEKIQEMVGMQDEICAGEEAAIVHMLETVELAKSCVDEMGQFCEPNDPALATAPKRSE